MNKIAYLLFTRIPIPGKVKTRLIPQLGGARCAALQKAMTLDAAHTLAQLPGDLFVFHSDEGSTALLDGLPQSARLLPQVGEDLGARMHHAIETVLQMGYISCLLLGSDLPFLSVDEVARPTEILKDHDIVLCPSLDGGYWLIGMHAPFRPVFEGQTYGTGSVFSDAIACCNAHGLHIGVGPTRSDLDTPADLDTLLASKKHVSAVHTGHTAAYLQSLSSL